MPLIQVGGMTIYTTNLQLPSLFPNNQGVMITMINGAFEAAACTFVIAKWIYTSYRVANAANIFWWTWLVLSATILFGRTFFLMPKIRIIDKKPEQQETSPLNEKNEIKHDDTKSNFLSEVLSLKFILHVCWFVMLDGWNIMFISCFLSWSNFLTKGDEEGQSYWVTIWGFAQFIGAPMSIFCF